MSDESDAPVEFFTRATWRPSKKRAMQKRINHWGGRKTAPPAFLEAAKRVAIQKGQANRRICTATNRKGMRCGRLALTGTTVCQHHGGAAVWAKQGKLQKSGKREAYWAEKAARIAAKEIRTTQPAEALINLPAYQNANQQTRMRLIKAYQTPAWIPLVLSLCV